MKRVRGWTEEQLRGREDVFDGLITKAVRMSLRPVALQLNQIVVAAPSVSTTDASLQPVVVATSSGTLTALWDGYVDKELQPFLVQTLLDSAAEVLAGMETALDVSIPKITDGYAQSYLASASNRLKGIGDLVWSEIKRELQEGLDDGEDMHQLATRVRKVSNVMPGRATTIARTEVHSAAEQGSLAQVQLGGFTDTECSKRWLPTKDTRTRPEHWAARGQTVGITQPFIVWGEGLQFPGDPSGRAENVIQCRCTMEYLFTDDADDDDLDDDLVTAAIDPDFDEKAHPRGHDGKFIKKGLSSLGVSIADINTMSDGEFVNWFNGEFGSDANENNVKIWQALTDVEKDVIAGKAADAHYGSKKSGPFTVVSDLDEMMQANIDLGYDPVILSAIQKLKDEKSDQSVKPDFVNELIDHEALAKASQPKTKKPSIVAKPMKINTTVIYKTEYANGAVVAEKPGSPNYRLVYSAAGQGKFVLQHQNADSGQWKTVETFGKGAAYKNFKDQAGWTTPAMAQQETAEKILAKYDPSKIVVKEMTTVTDYDEVASAVGGLGLTMTLFLTMSPSTFNKWFDHTFVDNEEQGLQIWKSLSPLLQSELTKKAIDAKKHGYSTPINTITLALMAGPPDVSDDPKIPYPDFEEMHVVALNSWFSNLTLEQYENFEEWEQEGIWDEAKAADDEFGNPKPLETLQSLTGKFHMAGPMSTLPDFTKIDTIDWFNDFKQADYDKLTSDEVLKVVTEAAKLNAAGVPAPFKKISSFSDNSNSSSLDDDIDFSTSNGPFLSIEKMNADEFKSYVQTLGDIDDPSDVYWDTAEKLGITPWAEYHIGQTSPYHVQGGGSTVTIKGTEVSVNPPVPDKLDVVGLPQADAHQAIHVYAVAKTKSAASIGEPATYDASFKTLTKASAKKLQYDMLAKSGKKWTSTEIAAVQQYTTKVGYQTSNAILRNDQARMKMFSTQQLEAGVQRAVDLQNAMTPLTESVILHRGTGAQAFGFSTTSVSTDELKKLEGKVIHDRGFGSTSVIAPKNIPFEYANKPVKVIVKAPAGTPGVYVTSAYPAWDTENEFILAAGTNYRIDEVRAASAADKASYGNGVQQVVTVTVVPHKGTPTDEILKQGDQVKTPAGTTVTPAPAPKAPPTQPIVPTPKAFFDDPMNLGVMTYNEKIAVLGNLTQSKWLGFTQAEKDAVQAVADDTTNPSLSKYATDIISVMPKATVTTPSTPSLPGKIKPAGSLTSIKLNTKTIHSTTYAPGAIVAVRHAPLKPGGSPVTQRLYWNGKLKKFILQVPTASGGWVNQQVLTKKDAYDTFKNDTNWYAPKVGENALTPGGELFTPANVATKLGLPEVAPVVTPPGKTTSTNSAKTHSISADEIINQYGNVPILPDNMNEQIWKSFKTTSGFGTMMLGKTSDVVFKALVHATAKWNENPPSGKKYNHLQVIKLVDQIAAAKAGIPNSNAYEKKIVDWLKSSAGQKQAPGLVTLVEQSIAQGSGSTPGANGLADLKNAYDIGTIDTSATVFPTITPSKAAAMHTAMRKEKPLTTQQIASIKYYTGSGSGPINETLRTPSGTSLKSTSAIHAVHIQDAMAPLPISMTVHRGTSNLHGAISGSGLPSLADVQKLVGKTFSDGSFFSTSVGEKAAFHDRTYQLQIEVPAGTPGVYVKTMSGSPHENELILAAGLHYEVIGVTGANPGQYGVKYNVRVRVVNPK